MKGVNNVSKEVNKFILEGEEIEFSDTKAREDITSLDTKIDNEVGRLETEISGKATIDDSDITTNKTWSSSQIFAEDNATREITATLNLTNRAEANYSAGDLIVYNSKLYKVTASINQGAALTPGTNIQLSKVSTELKGLENTCDNLQTQINNKATIDDSDITTSKTWSSSKILAEDNSIRENIATLNLTNLAEQNYNVGDLIEWNYKLCKVIAPISQGDLLELGVNINRTTIAEEEQIPLDMITENVEEGTTSEHNYNASFIPLLRRNNQLYRITNNINVGDALTENVNIKSETLSSLLALVPFTVNYTGADNTFNDFVLGIVNTMLANNYTKNMPKNIYASWTNHGDYIGIGIAFSWRVSILLFSSTDKLYSIEYAPATTTLTVKPFAFS